MKNTLLTFLMSFIILFTLSCNNDIQTQETNSWPETFTYDDSELPLDVSLFSITNSHSGDIIEKAPTIVSYKMSHGIRHVLFNSQLRSIGYVDQFYKELNQEELNSVKEVFNGVEDRVTFGSWEENEDGWAFSSFDIAISINNTTTAVMLPNYMADFKFALAEAKRAGIFPADV